jgi:hypothetical protein
MAQFRFTTSGSMNIRLTGLSFGQHLHDPCQNVKTFIVNPHEITLVATDEKSFTDWGMIELSDEAAGAGRMDVTIDSDAWGWYGTAQFAVIANGQVILNDNFQSGVRGPVGDPSVVKHYCIDNIG